MTRIELAVSASDRNALCALRTADGRIASLPGDAQTSTRGTDLIARIHELCAGSGVRIADLQAIRVDVGPGSYTGLRVAVTFARTLAAFGDVTLSRFTSVELIAAAAWQQNLAPADHELVVVLDARREHFHTARLALVDDRVALVTEPAALDRSALLTECSQTDGPPTTILTQDSVLADEDLASSLRRTAHVLPLPALHPAQLFLPSLPIAPCTVADLSPLYLMATYAD